jgi:hypothetical protein
MTVSVDISWVLEGGIQGLGWQPTVSTKGEPGPMFRWNEAATKTSP